MKVAPRSNSRRMLFLVTVVIALVSLFAAILWWPSVSPSPAPALTPVATLARGPATYLASTKLTTASAIKVDLSAPWQVVNLNADQLTSLLGKLNGGALTPSSLDAVETLLSALDRNSTALVALLLDEAATNSQQLPPNLTIMAAPRNGLSLARYLEGITTNLSGRPGVTLHESKIDYSLRPEGIPVATLHYTVDESGADSPSAAAMAPIDGYQIAAYDEQATQLIIFTFTTPAARYRELLPLFQEIIRTAQLNEGDVNH